MQRTSSAGRFLRATSSRLGRSATASSRLRRSGWNILINPAARGTVAAPISAHTIFVGVLSGSSFFVLHDAWRPFSGLIACSVSFTSRLVMICTANVVRATRTDPTPQTSSEREEYILLYSVWPNGTRPSGCLNQRSRTCAGVFLALPWRNALTAPLCRTFRCTSSPKLNKSYRNSARVQLVSSYI